MLERIDIAMTPAEALLLPAADCYLVIDALRATTTIATLFARGLARLTAVSTLDAGRSLRSSSVLLFGEQGGLRPEGFDYGNSPVEAAELDVRGRDAALVTSNGTVALCAVASRGATVAASLANLSAVARFAESHNAVCVVCAGNAGAKQFSLEDFAVAATIVRQLHIAAPDAVLADSARLAQEVSDPARLVGASTHAEILRTLGFEADIRFARRQDTSSSVPVVTSFGEGLAVLENHQQQPENG